MPKVSAGLLMYRQRAGEVQVLLVHPGGPYWKNKNEGWWTIPKGELAPGEDALSAAIREFNEETGLTPCGPYLELGNVKMKSGKIVHAWAYSGDCDPERITSNQFETEWPPKSGRMQSFPEVDRAEFFSMTRARQMILPAQAQLLDMLLSRLTNQAGVT